jgi:glycosyltransferase involved in cell wall biosynthesis
MHVALIDPSLFTLPYDRGLAEGLESTGHKVTLFGRKSAAQDNAADGISLAPHFYRVANSRAARGLPKHLRLALKGIDHAVSMLRLPAALRRQKVDVIHFQWLVLPLIDSRMLARLRQVAPLVLTVHDTKPFNGDPSAGVQQRGFMSALAAFDRLIVHTRQGWERMVEAGVPSDRLALVPHGHLVEPPPTTATDRMDGVVTFLLFGKIKPYKGLDLLIEAFASMPPDLQAQARIRVVGKPYMDLAPFYAQAARLGIADRLEIEPRFIDDDEIPSIFGPGVVAVFPYREIEASGVLSIALAHGRPVIASELGNFAETITDGLQGNLVPPEDATSLGLAMAHLLSDRAFAAQCSVEASALFRSIPSWREIGRLTGGVYRAAGVNASPAEMLTHA